MTNPISIIVKVQQSLCDSDGVKRVLIYDEADTVTLETEMPAEFAELMGSEPKAFFEAEIVGEEISIIRRVEMRDW